MYTLYFQWLMQIKMFSHVIEKAGCVMRITYNWAKAGVHTFDKIRKRRCKLDLQETIVVRIEILVF